MAGHSPDAPQYDLPPWPWPNFPDDPRPHNCSPGPVTCWGGVGTLWIFRASDVRDRLLALGARSQDVETALGIVELIVKKLEHWLPRRQCDIKATNDPVDPWLTWATPPLAEGDPVSLYAVRASVHAQIGTVEEMMHVFHLVKPRGGAISAVTASDLVTLGGTIRGLWDSWFNVSVSGLGAVANSFSTNVHYNEVRLALVEYVTPPTKPTFHVPTQYSSWSSTRNGTATDQMPNEVALCLTLYTANRGRSSRGRVYLGGLNTQLLASNTGLFNTAYTRAIAAAFGTSVIDGLHSGTDYDFAVVSARSHEGNRSANAWAAPSALGVGGIGVGAVPDSQRNRRKKQPESSYVAWGTKP